MKPQIEAWEKPKTRRLVLAGVIGSIGGMAVMVVVSLIFKAIGWGHVSPGILFIPWMVVVILMIPAAYHQGVCDERKRGVNKEQQGGNL